MPDTSLNKDIEFQPKTQEYAYSSAPAEKKKRLNTIFTLLLSLSLILFLLIVILGTLNYFNVISLSTIHPIFTKLQEPKPYNIPETNQYVIEGTLYGYSQDIIKVKLNNTILSFKFNIGESVFYTQVDPKNKPAEKEATEIVQVLGFFSDLEQEINIGKNVTVQYIKDKNGNNIIQTILLKK